MKKRVRREPIVLSQMRPLTLFAVLCGCILFTYALMNLTSVTQFLHKIVSALGPIFAGLMIAYLLNPMQTWLELRFRKMLRPLEKKHIALYKLLPRGISSFLAVLLFVGTAVLLIVVTISQVTDDIENVIAQMPHYIDVMIQKAETLLHGHTALSDYLTQFSEQFFSSQTSVDPTETAQTLVSAVLSGAVGTLELLYNVVIGFIVSVYLLISKERFIRQFRQVLFAVFRPATAEKIDRKMLEANKTFGTAIVGKLADSALVGCICFIGLVIMKMPYTALIAVMIGITNVIPFFGPIIGAIPCILLILLKNPLKAVYFSIFIVILQQFDCNILDPRIVGKSIGLPAFWELFACLLGGGLFGIWGMVFGVPLFAVLYTIIQQVVRDAIGEKEISEDILVEKLGIDPKEIQRNKEDDDDDSDYTQHLILLEEIAENPTEK